MQKENLDSETNLDQNQVYLSVHFTYNKGIREIGAAIISMNERLFQVAQFQDNEHFSNFESLLFQINPQNSYAKFNLLINYPNLSTETVKIKEILNLSDVQPIEKQKKEYPDKINEKDLVFLLESPLKNYVNELNLHLGMSALGCALSHLKLSSEAGNNKQFKLNTYTLTNFMKLDLAAINALSIFSKNIEKKGGNNEYGTLVDLLDKCKTQIGSRTLRRWLKQPLQNAEEITKRLDLVGIFIEESALREELQSDFLRKIPDLDKLYPKFYKIHSNQKHSAGLIDVIKVYQLVTNIKNVAKVFNKFKKEKNFLLEEKFYEPLMQCLKDFEKLEEMIEKAIDLEKAREGEYMIRPQFSKKLTEISSQITNTLKDIEKVRQGIENDLGIDVKLVESNTYTYLFEVSKKTGDAAIRGSSKKYRQISIKNNKIAFNNDKLVELCSSYSESMSIYKQEQSTVVDKILSVVSTYYPAMERASSIISELDVLTTFAVISANAPIPYIRPNISKNGELILRESRHPCLELTDKQNCVSNDCEMNPQSSKLHIITGPNMGGKSTYIRQVAIIVLMAHIGCFVPCHSASIPIIDALITRVGASDMQLRGISTFMSEMLEAACMLKIGTNKSLIIIDELGRGTSTSEGFGLAWAIAEYIVKNLGSYCLFATHFHEMTMMEGHIPGVKNYYVSAIIKQGKLTMLYKVRPGAVDRSYGLFVAEMLNFPEEILKDAKKKARELENYENFIAEHAEDKIDEEKENKKKEMDFLDLCKNANSLQKKNVIQIVEETQKELEEELDEEIRKKRMIELKQKVKEILIKG